MTHKVDMLLFRRSRTSASTEPRRLPSATPDVAFTASFTVRWRPAGRCRANLEDLVRQELTDDAGGITSRFEAYDAPAAQDAVNAALGTTRARRRAHYRRIDARVTLSISADDGEVLRQRRFDTERIRRLIFLRTQLYSDPALYVIDRIETAGRVTQEDVRDMQELARWLGAGDRWWYPILEQWNAVGRGFTEADMQIRALGALHKALDELKNPP